MQLCPLPRGYGDADDQGHNDGCMYRMSYRQSVLTTDGISNDDVDAEGHSDKKVEYQSDNRNISSDAGDSNGIVGPAEMTDDGQIRSQEQLFQNNSCCYRQGKQRILSQSEPCSISILNIFLMDAMRRICFFHGGSPPNDTHYSAAKDT